MPDRSPPPSPAPRPEDTLVDPLALLTRSLDALAAITGSRGHVHPPRTACPPSCREARAVLALAGRIPFTQLSQVEKLAVLRDETAEVRRLASTTLEQVRATGR